MKLLQKTNRIYLLFAAVLLFITGILLYFIFTRIVKTEITEKLIINKERISKELADGKNVPSLPPVITIEELPSGSPVKLSIKDTLLFDPVEEDIELFHEIASVENINDKTYRITLRQVILEPHDYYNSIGFVLLVTMCMLLVCFLFFNWRISKKIWKPFYKNLETIKKYAVSEQEKIVLISSNITEFSELNTAVENFTDKILSDYRALKEFTENASHELQTPLAIINTKLESFLQSEELTNEQADQIQSAYSAAIRLTKLNRSLLLLSRIENHQFTDTETVYLKDIVEKQLYIFDEFIKSKELKVSLNLNSDLLLLVNVFLIETLISNLIGNAIKHNFAGGNITIDLNENIFSIINTGKTTAVKPEQLFQRFKKADQASVSPGLGLSISRKICELHHWRIGYEQEGELHIIKVNF